MKTTKAPDWVLTLNLDPRQFRDADLPPEPMRRKLEPLRLFSLKTRRYLQRRAWRYFRNVGKTHPERYVGAITEALVLYQDADVDSGLALLDNWGLVHALFHHSPVLEARPRGWLPVDGRSLSELAPAPAFMPLWEASPPALFELIRRGACRPVRRWAMAMLSRDPGRACEIGLETIVQLLDHEDGEVVAWAAELLSLADDLSSLTTDRWLNVARTAGPEAVERLAELMAKNVKPDQVPLIEAARLAASRPLPLARLGLTWLETRHPASDDERSGLLALLEAECQPLRPAILAWLRSVLSASGEFQREWALAFLDCRQADARAEGMKWFREEPEARDDVTLWQSLLESPYDDVRLSLVARAGSAAVRGPRLLRSRARPRP